MLVASIIGIDTRATMDIDTTVRALSLNEEDAVKIVEKIIRVPVEDRICFEITKVTKIMTDFEYPGIRMVLEAKLDRLKQRIKIDISTDEVIIPSAIRYEYQLMFEERSIELLTYTTETLLAEAFLATCIKRKTRFSSTEMKETLKGIQADEGLPKLWTLYRKDNFYVGELEWTLVCETVCTYILEKM
ncbi:MAG: nucleotidyl transferase AbiEii/AbiGii toxin family protein [Suipraeoptans sp.]